MSAPPPPPLPRRGGTGRGAGSRQLSLHEGSEGDGLLQAGDPSCGAGRAAGDSHALAAVELEGRAEATPRPAVRSFSCARSGTGISDRISAWPMSLREREAQHAVDGATPRADRGVPGQGSSVGQNHRSAIRRRIGRPYQSLRGYSQTPPTGEVEVDHRLVFAGGYECQRWDRRATLPPVILLRG